MSAPRVINIVHCKVIVWTFTLYALVGIVEAWATVDKLGASARLLVAVIVPSSVDTTNKYDDQLRTNDGPH
jgi:hypothetical protein